MGWGVAMPLPELVGEGGMVEVIGVGDGVEIVTSGSPVTSTQ